MKIIVLQGPPNSGKSTVLHQLIARLEGEGVVRFVCRSDQNRFLQHKDCTVPLLYDDRLLVVASCGDSTPDLLAPYDNYNGLADVFVCAAHPRGPTAMVVETWEKTHPGVVVVKKHRDPAEDQQIVEELMQIIILAKAKEE